MSRTMLTRITAMLLAVILLLTAGIGVFGWQQIRSRRLSDRLSALTKDARQIAYLAAQTGTGTTVYTFGTSISDILKEKARQVYSEYGAYIVVVDRRGRVMDNYSVAQASDPDFTASLNSRNLSEALMKVLQGQEIAVRAQVGGKSTFTVGVPFVQNGYTLGAVLLQTPAQSMEGGLRDWLLPIFAAAVVAVALAALLIFLYVRRVLKPLHAVTDAARQMTSGNFAARVDPPRSSPEINELASAFNTMADRLDDVERGRREFVANVSHELRSPMTSISGFVNGMEDGTIPVEEHPKYLRLVSDETKRLSALISQLLALSRLERDDAALELSDFDICETLRRAVIRRINDLEQKHMDIECRFDPDPCMVHADSDRIEQVVINLVDNAIRFTPQGGRVTLITMTQGDRQLVRVSDNGVGIIPEDRPHVFERFFTADRAHTAGKGTGLGLAISQRIMEMHHSRIVLQDTAEGASFAFTLEKGKELPRKSGTEAMLE